MKKNIKKTTLVLVGVLSICLAVGNVLLAAGETPGNRAPASGLIGGADITDITTGFSKDADSDTSRAVETESNGGDVIIAADVEFVSRPFGGDAAASTDTTRSDSRNSNSDVIDAADLGFVGSGERTELCEIDGVKIFTAELCAR